MEESTFLGLWKFYFQEVNLLGKVFLILFFPYLWLAHALANSGYGD